MVTGGWEITGLWTTNGNDLVAEYAGGIQLILAMQAGTNPVSTRPAGGWSVSTYNTITTNVYSLVDSGTATTSFTPSPGVLSIVSITSDSYTTYDSQASYTFTLSL